MLMFAAWIVFPLALAVLALGCALLLERAAGIEIQGGLLLPAGIATIVVLAGLPITFEATAPLATPLVVIAAVAGFATSTRWRRFRPDWWMVATGLAVFAVYAAPIVLSGDPTFAGYIKLDDTATWIAITDHVMTSGRSLDGLAPSTYEATLAVYPGDGYPIGVNLPWGVVDQLTPQDPAWTFMPYQTLLAVGLATAFYVFATPLLESRPLRALSAFTASQAALLFGFVMWGGVKEVAAAMLIALAAGLLPAAMRASDVARAVIPLAITAAAIAAVLSFGGLVWIGALLVVAAAWGARAMAPQRLLRAVLAFVLVFGVASIPVIATGRLFPPVENSVTSEAVLNLLRPLDKLQIFGVWPSDDFRFRPSDMTVAHVLVAVVFIAGLVGAWIAVRRRAWSVLIYAGTTIAGGLAIAFAASPWVDSKAMATASPAFLLLGLVGMGRLWEGGRRIESGIVIAAIVGGVLWSNALAYSGVSLAPYDQLAELEEIGDSIAGEGPTLMTESQTYGLRHFLREADPEGASGLRRRPVELAAGGVLEKGEYADTDELALGALMVYRTLVLRRSPAQSRPPLPYSLRDRGKYYEVWQRPTEATQEVVEHLGLGGPVDPAAVPSCRSILDLAAAAAPGEGLVAATAPPLVVVALGRESLPSGWEPVEGTESAVIPGDQDGLTMDVEVTAAGPYEIWLGGSVNGRVELLANGMPVGSVRHLLNNSGQYISFGKVELRSGVNTLELRHSGADLHPGSGGEALPIGPLVLRPAGAAAPVQVISASRAGELCGRRLDWVELVSG
jgi:hypothetical protein